MNSADILNHNCYCRTFNPRRWGADLVGGAERAETGLKSADDSADTPLDHAAPDHLLQSLMIERPNLFASTAVFITGHTHRAMVELVATIERVVALPAFQAQALARAPAVAGHAFGPVGACMGYDFHISAQGPQLIEINTNAGGALLNVELLRAQEACCEPMALTLASVNPADALEEALFGMFVAEWRLQRGDAPLGTVAIVDEDPASQYLAPEFELFKQLFERHGLVALITDPSRLHWHNGRLWHEAVAIDLVYNRLTDFYLSGASCQAVRQAYEVGAVVLTPHPRAHALYADKRNLTVLSDDAQMNAWGLSARDRNILQAGIPHTEIVTAARADALWAARRQLFFKPATGFGGRAAYKGEKLTKRVWGEILAGDYVAQALVPPAGRGVEVDGLRADLKFDVRAYAYNGGLQLLAARMYAGQTTNFRTRGGGFAPVIAVPS